MKDSSDHSTVDFLQFKKDHVSKCLLLEIRETYKISQNQAAILLSLHKMTISKIERGKASHNNEIYLKLLILRDVSQLPGAIQAINYILDNVSGHHAYHAAMSLKLAAQL